jgi:hypothetical protein
MPPHRALFASLLLSPFACAQTPSAAAPSKAPVRVLFDGLRGDMLQPQVAVRKDGALALVFAHLPKLRVAVRLPGGDWQEPHTVVESPDFAVGMHRGPRVAWAGEALLVSCIEARFDARNKTMHGSRDLAVRRSTDLGATFHLPVIVNGERGSAAEGLHALAADGDQVAVVWLDARGEPKGSKLWCAQSHDGGRTFGADFVAHQSPNGIFRAAIRRWRSTAAAARSRCGATSSTATATSGTARSPTARRSRSPSSQARATGASRPARWTAVGSRSAATVVRSPRGGARRRSTGRSATGASSRSATAAIRRSPRAATSRSSRSSAAT